MNTKTFAQQSRALLMEGVANKLLYWGFKPDGTTSEEPNSVAGGYTFRGKVFDDESVPKLWKSLHQAINKKGIDVVKEEAAYTWFNRIMALQIMAKNDFLEAQLAYVPGMANTPQILQKARQGQYSFLSGKEQERLKRIITDFSKEQEAFALLLVGYCHSNKMLNNVFGKLDDYTELLLPDNMLQDSGFLHLLNTTDAISDEQYKEVELIGWLYQFYISERKDEVFASFKKKKKAEAKDIPAATQIFTPNWIVKYMVQNTVGKIWLDKNPNSKIKSSLRYLVENDTSTELSASSDSTSEPIISDVSQLTLIDPAAGSGHILVEGFDLLYQMYMEEYYTPEEAVESILKNNLFGLDLDDRAAQLATFAILLKAAKQYRDVFAKGWLPNVYGMPEYATFSEQEIKDFLGSEGTSYEKELTVALRLMEQAKNLGSVMKLTLSDNARISIEERFTNLKNTDFRDLNTEIVYQKIKTFIPVLLILSNKYTSVVANPPYMGKKNMNSKLKDYLCEVYPDSWNDLMTAFMDVNYELLIENGLSSMINIPSWMFLSTNESLRIKILKTTYLSSVLHFGRGIFGSDFGSVAFCYKKSISEINKTGIYRGLYDKIGNVESNEIKENYFFDKKFKSFNHSQSEFLNIPQKTISYWLSSYALSVFSNNKCIKDLCPPVVGMMTADNDKFVRNWQELSIKKIGFNFSNKEQAKVSSYKWFPYNKGGDLRRWYGNNEYVVNWQNGGQEIFESGMTSFRGKNYYFKKGITWSFFGFNAFGVRYKPEGFIFDISGMSCFPLEDKVYYYTSLLNSKVGFLFLQAVAPTVNFQANDVGAVPIIFPDNFENINNITKNNIQISKVDWDSKEISWDFVKNPLLGNETSIQDAYQKWLNNVSIDFFQLLKNEEELNNIFIDIYSLRDDIVSETSLKDITLLQQELKKNDLEALEEKFRSQGKDSIELPINRGEVISQFISYAIGLFMGRYRLDKPGLNIAHPNPTKEELSSYTYNHGEVIIDQDAILPLMGKNCNFNDDVVKQFTQLLDTIWGHEQRTENINFIQECLDKELDKFIVNDFWSYHCGMYKKTPIYWLFSSKKGAFQVLVYMHRMNEFTVEKIRANYLLEHLKYLKSEITQKEANASSLSTAEARQLDKLRADLLECEQYDMTLKNIADQQIKFDLDDGVAKNYELFESVVAKIK
jgi:type II restriction/modification system DNA methylase subunit YeeA